MHDKWQRHFRSRIIPADYKRCWRVHQCHSKDCSWGKVQQEALHSTDFNDWWTGQPSNTCQNWLGRWIVILLNDDQMMVTESSIIYHAPLCNGALSSCRRNAAWCLLRQDKYTNHNSVTPMTQEQEFTCLDLPLPLSGSQRGVIWGVQEWQNSTMKLKSP